jgi:hypothetical protein
MNRSTSTPSPFRQRFFGRLFLAANACTVTGAMIACGASTPPKTTTQPTSMASASAAAPVPTTDNNISNNDSSSDSLFATPASSIGDEDPTDPPMIASVTAPRPKSVTIAKCSSYYHTQMLKNPNNQGKLCYQHFGEECVPQDKWTFQRVYPSDGSSIQCISKGPWKEKINAQEHCCYNTFMYISNSGISRPIRGRPFTTILSDETCSELEKRSDWFCLSANHHQRSVLGSGFGFPVALG